MTRMNEKKWEETLNCLKGNTYDIHEFENEVISLCETEGYIYVGDFQKVPYHSTEWVGVYEETSESYILLEVVRDEENETIEVIDGVVKNR